MRRAKRRSAETCTEERIYRATTSRADKLCVLRRAWLWASEYMREQARAGSPLMEDMKTDLTSKGMKMGHAHRLIYNLCKPAVDT